jgi:hypothetical protein
MRYTLATLVLCGLVSAATAQQVQLSGQQDLSPELQNGVKALRGQQPVPPGVTPPPDMSGLWGRTTTFGYELPDSGPGPLRNTHRRADGSSDPWALVGDHTNPILKPATAEIVKKKGEISLSGKAFPDPANQCQPMPPPFIFRVLNVQVIQTPDRVTFLYMQDNQVRHVRLNQTHPGKVAPSWYGDSVGYYEGDTLVIDTVGIKPGPNATVDMFGTPHSEALHVVERYRLVDYETARAGQERAQKEYGSPTTAPVYVDFGYRGKGLQLQFLIEDENVLTTSWSGSVTYRRAVVDWQEQICAENPNEYYDGTVTPIPQAVKADF